MSSYRISLSWIVFVSLFRRIFVIVCGVALEGRVTPKWNQRLMGQNAVITRYKLKRVRLRRRLNYILTKMYVLTSD